MADMGASEILLADALATGEGLGGFGALSLGDATAGLIGAEAAGIGSGLGAAGATGLGTGAATGIGGLSGAGMTPYLTAIESGVNPALAQQLSAASINAAETFPNPVMQQLVEQNIANQGFSQAELDAINAGQNDALNANRNAYAPTASTNTVASDAVPEPLVPSAPSSPFQLQNTTSGQGIDSSAKLRGYRAADIGDLYKPIFDTSPTSVAKPATSGGDFLSGLNKMLPDSTMGKVGLGLTGLMAYDKLFGPKYGVPGKETYSGPLSKFRYSPATYQPVVTTPNVYTPRYADGGLMDGNQGIAGLSANPNYPTAQQQNPRYAVPSQMPVGATDVRMAHLQPTAMASGGSANLGGYSDGGRMLKGPGDGMSDSIPASIGGKQPARLADGEFVVPADVVSHLGNGSTDAGAKQLYKMMDKVRTARTGKKAQGKQINPKKYVPA